ncbi:MAG: hypothetical protein ACTS7E_04420 [Arsenophonus sp. NC-CH8-MAG3]
MTKAYVILLDKLITLPLLIISSTAHECNELAAPKKVIESQKQDEDNFSTPDERVT